MKFRIYTYACIGTILAGCWGGGTESQVATVETPAHLHGPEALVYATQGGDMATLKRFVEQDPSLLQAYDRNGNTLLHIAGGYNRLKVVNYLLEQGASSRAVNFYGQNCFEYADSEGADPAVLNALRN